MTSAKTQHVAQMTDRELIEAALIKWGGPVEMFAEQVVGINPSTLRRWRSGESGLNRRRRHQLTTYLLALAPPLPTTTERQTP